MTFSDYFKTLNIDSLLSQAQDVTRIDCERILKKSKLDLNDFIVLLSPAMQEYIEPLAQRAQAITIQRFGKTMSLFAPMYLSNWCYNRCTYCGFSMDLDYDRVVLSDDEILKEAKTLSSSGIQHVLLLTGEAPDKAGVDYIEHAVCLIKPYFSSIGIEIQPLKTHDYQRLIKAGVDTLTVYQETYHKESYMIYHLSGKKSRFDHRLETLDRGGEAGFHRLNLGALLGLYEWRYEALSIAHHIDYLKKRYWKSKFGISFPRIKSFVGQFDAQYTISDLELVQYICAFRLLFPDLSISLSTRESKLLRNRLIHLGITSMSAGSHTEPGGYSGSGATCQFDISDERSVKEVCCYLEKQGFDPMLKDWDLKLVTA